MAATRAAQNRKLRQEALREQLSKQKLVEQVIETAKKLQEQGEVLEGTHIQALKASAEIRMKLINKYLPDLKSQEIEHTGSIGYEDWTEEDLKSQIQNIIKDAG